MGHKIFTFGGAQSTDKMWRVEGVSWWAREMPSQTEYDCGYLNLERANWEVEYVFTHYNEVYQQYKFKERSLDRKIADKTLIERGIKFRYSGTYYYIDKDLGIWIKDGHEYHLVEVFDQDGNKMIAKTDTMYCNTFNVVGMIDTEYKHYN